MTLAASFLHPIAMIEPGAFVGNGSAVGQGRGGGGVAGQAVRKATNDRASGRRIA